MIEHNTNKVSVAKQCELLDITRSRVYYKPKPLSNKDIEIMNEIHDIYKEAPFFGYRKIHVMLNRRGYSHNIKRTQRLMKLTELRAIYPKKNTSIANAAHAKYPYLLKGVKVVRPNQVWQVDITYIKLRRGFGYLVCLIDLFTRRIMGWAFSPFLETEFCIEALENALKIATPEIINSDQGSQFTSQQWVDALNYHSIKISMDGKGRWVDNVFVERLWRTIKYEAVYLHSYDTMQQAKNNLTHYIEFYNQSRPHQSLGYKTPDEIYFNSQNQAHLLTKLNHDVINHHNKQGGELSQIQPILLS